MSASASVRSPKRKQRSEETALSRAIQQTLTAKGCRVIRIQSGIVPALYGATKRFIHCAPPGTPDLLVIRQRTDWPEEMHPRPGASFAQYTWLEVKRTAGKQTEAQQQWEFWARVSGVRSFVVRGVQEAIDAVFHSEVRS